MPKTNWSGNLSYSSDVIDVESVEQLQEVVTGHKQVKVVATGHTFNDIADSSVALVSLHKMNHILKINDYERTVTIEAGVRYGELAIALHQAGYALHNLASLPHINVVGACMTGTHGSGMQNGNLATAVTAIEFMDAEDNLIYAEVENKIFNGMIVNLGAIGIITKMTLKIEPTYDVRQTVFLDLPMADFLTNFEEVMSAGYSVSAFTDWQSDNIQQIWVKQKANETPITDLFGATQATRNYHPIAEISPDNSTLQLGELGAWHERLPHFQLDFMPSKGDELQSEYFVSREHAIEAIEALQSIGEMMQDVLLVSEIRCIAGDNLWMSPCYQRDSAAFHFTWQQNWSAVRDVLVEIERVLEPFAPRPHWGKLFTMSSATIQSLYPRFNNFRELVLENDAQGKFRNRYLSTLLDQ
ncbi:MAG: D-arabinono-1,4-lactone oxidase [Chloroflexota bacterium]